MRHPLGLTGLGCALVLVLVGCSSAPAPPVVVTSTMTSLTTVAATVTATVTTTTTVATEVTRTVTTTVTTTPPPPVDLSDIAGPDGGPPCAVAPGYVDEPPTGLPEEVAAAWADAVAAAARDGITLCLNDGKRSAAQQQAVYDDYVRRYGTEAADSLVLRPEQSAHVTGTAIDVQPASGAQWLQATGGSLGWCRIYDNEPWHFEYDPTFAEDGCPEPLAAPVR